MYDWSKLDELAYTTDLNWVSCQVKRLSCRYDWSEKGWLAYTTDLNWVSYHVQSGIKIMF